MLVVVSWLQGPHFGTAPGVVRTIHVALMRPPNRIALCCAGPDRRLCVHDLHMSSDRFPHLHVLFRPRDEEQDLRGDCQPVFAGRAARGMHEKEAEEEEEKILTL